MMSVPFLGITHIILRCLSPTLGEREAENRRANQERQYVVFQYPTSNLEAS